jgi:sulfide:quinone oxidoreductase
MSETRAHVVVAGAGVAGLEAVIALHEQLGSRVRITVIDPARQFVYTPMTVGEPFAMGPARRISLAEFAKAFDCTWIHESVEEVVPALKRVVMSDGEEIGYDRLILARGAERVPAYSHATTFRGAADVVPVQGLIRDIEDGYTRSVGFVVPPGVAWSLPIYELALMTAERAYGMNVPVELTLVTPEAQALPVFGPAASADVQRLLDDAGIAVHWGVTAEIPAKGTIKLHPGGGQLLVDRVVALPRIRGRHLDGVPADADGFIPVDDFARVPKTDGIYAAGDGANFPVKQGGIACQQADVAVSHIARELGVPVEVKPLRPVLRAQLLTGRRPHFMRRDLRAHDSQAEASSGDMLWSPPSKVAGTYLAPYLEQSCSATT